MDSVPTEREVRELRDLYQAALARTHEYSVANLHAEATISSLRARAEAAERLNGELVDILMDIMQEPDSTLAMQPEHWERADELLARIESASTSEGVGS